MPPLSHGQPDRDAQAGRDGAALGHRRSHVASASCSPTSATAAASRLRSRCRTRGCGRCTRRSASRTRRTRTSGVSCCAGSSTACPTSVETRPVTDRVEPGQPVTLTRRRRRSALRRAERRQRRRARHVAVGPGECGAAAVDGRAQRPVSRDARRPRRPAGTRPRSKRRATASRSAPRVTHVRAAPDDAEYFDAAMHAPLLQADRAGDRRPLLHGRQRRVAARGPEVFRPRRHRGRRARAVAHAGAAADAGRACSASSGDFAATGGWRDPQKTGEQKQTSTSRAFSCCSSVCCCRSSAFAQSTHLLIVVGLPGDPEHGELFKKWGTTLADDGDARSSAWPRST